MYNKCDIVGPIDVFLGLCNIWIYPCIYNNSLKQFVIYSDIYHNNDEEVTIFFKFKIWKLQIDFHLIYMPLYVKTAYITWHQPWPCTHTHTHTPF